MPTNAASIDSPATTPDAFRPWLLGATVMLFAARPLLTSEGTPGSGDALIFAALPLLLTAAWALRALTQRGAMARFGLFDLLLLAYVAWNAVGTLLAVRHAAPRPAVNVFWQTTALALMLFLIRQLIESPREMRAIVVVMLGVATAESVLGIHQFFVTIPRDQEFYRQDPNAALLEARVDAPLGSRQREMFEKRVESSEPMGTFALANSLAGFLDAWLVVACGIAAAAVALGHRRLREWLPVALVAILVGACLILTKSRAAAVGVLFGFLFLGVWTASRGARLSRRVLAISTTVVAVLLIAAGLIGALDRKVLTEAGKSLGYRLQYWQSTVALIFEHPWFGCGPGQFQNAYMRYKLPEASESIADPHNFLFEVWGTAGTPAALLLVLMIGYVAWRVYKFAPAEEHAADAPDKRHEQISPHRRSAGHSQRRDHRVVRHASTPNGSPHDNADLIWISGLAAFVFAYFISPLAFVPLSFSACSAGVLISAAVSAALFPWVRDGRLPTAVPAIAAAALLVNLSAAGGITYGGVAASLCLLTALCLSATEQRRPLPTAACAALLGVLIIAGACFHFTEYAPVMASNLDLDRATSNPESAEMYLRKAAEADPLAAEPLRRMAMLEWAEFQQRPSEMSFSRFLKAIDGALALDPQSAGLAELKGDICFAVNRQGTYPQALPSAVNAYRRSVELYPASITAHAKLALALAAANDQADASSAAAEALRLHALTSHGDVKKLLTPETIEQLKALAPRPN